MIKLSSFLGCLFVSVSVLGQKADMQLFKFDDAAIIYPRVIGRVGAHYMVYDEASSWPSRIYTFDSLFRFVNLTGEYVNESNLNFLVTGNRMHIRWRNWSKDNMSVSITTFDETGNKQGFFHEQFYFPYADIVSPKFISDERKRYHAYYSFVPDTTGNNYMGAMQRDNKAYLRAVLLDSNFHVISNAFYPVSLDRKLSLSMVSPLYIDGTGNMHFVVYDKLSNYHLSTSLSLYTVPLGKTEARRESMEFEKTKFNRLLFSEDTGRNVIKLIGFYYDGQERNKKGVASLAFEYNGTSNQQLSHLYPFPESMAAVIRPNLREGRKKDDPAENIQIHDALEKDDHLLLTNVLIDLPRYQLLMDRDMDKETKPVRQEKDGRTYNPPGDNTSAIDAILKNSANFNARTGSPLQIDTKNPGQLTSVNYVPVYTSPPGGTPPMLSYGSGSSFSDPSDPAQIRLAQIRNAGKQVFFNIDDKGGFEYQVIAPTKKIPGGSDNYPVFNNGRLIFLTSYFEVPKQKGAMPEHHFALGEYNTMGEFTGFSDFKFPSEFIFYKMTETAPGVFMTGYKNRSSGEQGIAVWRITNTGNK